MAAVDGEDLSHTVGNIVHWCDNPNRALTIEYFASRYSYSLLDTLRNKCWICGGQSRVVAVEFQDAVVSLPTILSPVLLSQVFSARGWKYIMGMAIDTKFVFGINIFIF
jgi:hypothetical protein